MIAAKKLQQKVHFMKDNTVCYVMFSNWLVKQNSELLFVWSNGQNMILLEQTIRKSQD